MTASPSGENPVPDLERPDRDTLLRLASLCGVLPGYHDVWGRYHEADPESLVALLGDMGVPAASPDEVRAETLRRESAADGRLEEPVVLLSEDDPQRLTLRVLPGPGTEVTARRDGRQLPLHAPVAEPASPDGPRVTVTTNFAARLPLGVHRVELSVRSAGTVETATTVCAVAPPRAYEPDELREGRRLWGINIPLYGVRSGRNWGIGDFADLYDAVGWAAQLGAGMVGLLPLHALFNEPPLGVSPYYPSSRLWLNPIHIALQDVPEAADPRVGEFCRTDDTLHELERLRRADRVDHGGVWRLKRRALERCHDAFATAHFHPASARGEAFRAWRASRGEPLEDFATFCTLRDHLLDTGGHPRPWPEWPAEYRRPGTPAVRAFRQEHPDRVRFHAYLQWLAEEQLARCAGRAKELGMPVGLYLDMALGVDPCGADAWVHQDVLALEASAGAPPDPFSLMGQRWGVPPLIPERHRQTGYRAFRETVAQNARRAGALRLDHVLSLWRLFWVPKGLPASRGTYVTDRADELLALLRLESREARCLIVGEDLGTIPPEVKEALMASGCYSYRLLIFEKNGDGRYRPPGAYPRQCLVSMATHDLPTSDGFWLGRDLEVKRELGQYPGVDAERGDAEGRRWDRLRLLEALAAEGLLPPELLPAHEVPAERLDELAAACHAFLARTPSALLLANLDDLLGGLEMQNLPGTTVEHPNWVRKCDVPLERWASSARAARIAEAIGREGRGSAAV